MIVLLLFVMTLLVFAAFFRWHRGYGDLHPSSLGHMSQQWVSECQASQRAPAI